MKKGRLLLMVMVAFFLGSTLHAADPIRIGVLVGLSGPEGFIGEPSKAVALMAASEINAAGGIAGRPLELVFADTQSNPGKAALEAKRLIEQEKVIAIAGPTGTGSAMAILKIVQDSRTPTVGFVGGTPPVEPVRQFMFKSPQKTVTAVERTYMYFKDKGIRKIAIMTASDNFGQEGRSSLEKLAPGFGIQIIEAQTFDVTDSDVSVQLTKIKKADPQAVVCWTIGGVGAIVTKNYRQLGLAMPLIQCHGQADPKYLELAGPAAEGTILPTIKLLVLNQIPKDDPQMAVLVTFKNDYENKKKIGKTGAHSGYAWDAMQLLALGLKKSGGKGGIDLAKGIESVKGYVGVSGIYNMSADEHCGLGVDSMVMVQVKDGKWTLIK
ncbi:MAG TPA: ABC transporter substrate-binding protein [Deltaproteobacteria bacterium]|nr:ABC transporter substrate-binding protein [Deltaproteobacteria bacterium]HPR55645.1 ABC transporter substrate-binding protein [Deltaproteobacteria bacterium]HXK47418.1 ABC transporter substrate-binding protein [Deltaproteobacteria bacterium]